MNKILYHYCSNRKAFSILEYQKLRLSDIRKSNDYLELEMFFPEILSAVMDIYTENPFEFKYMDKHQLEAMHSLNDDVYDYIVNGLNNGNISNYVLCFSESGDMLSQWRGYADDGKGVCLGFDKNAIATFCIENNKVFNLVRVEYINRSEIKEIITQKANELLDTLKDLRDWIVQEMTQDDNDPATDSLIGFNYSSMIESLLTESLQYKLDGYNEEKEWRIHINSSDYKNPDWVFPSSKEQIVGVIGPTGFAETLETLYGRLNFNITDNDLVPFIELSLDEIGADLVRSITLGPNNNIKRIDLELYLKKYKYNPQIKFKKSGLSYRQKS